VAQYIFKNAEIGRKDITVATYEHGLSGFLSALAEKNYKDATPVENASTYEQMTVVNVVFFTPLGGDQGNGGQSNSGADTFMIPVIMSQTGERIGSCAIWHVCTIFERSKMHRFCPTHLQDGLRDAELVESDVRRSSCLESVRDLPQSLAGVPLDHRGH
jgi:hypothetical protein